MPLPRFARFVSVVTVVAGLAMATLPSAAGASDATALRLQNTPSATGYVRVPNHVDFSMKSFTLEAWVQRMGVGNGFTTDPTGSGIVSKPHEGVCGSNIASWHMDYSNTGQIMFNLVHAYSSSGLYLQSPPLADPLARHHIATTFDEDSCRIYVDGVELAAAKWTLGTVYYGTEDVLIGANNWACGYLRGFDGWIDDVRIWNYARSGAEIAAKKDCRLTGTETGLVGYWTFDGSDLSDQTGHGHDGAIVGTALGYGALASLGSCTSDVGPGRIGGDTFAMTLGPVPARDRVTVGFTLARPGPVVLDVWDVAGRRLAVWSEDWFPAGRHEVGRELDAGLGAGVRFVRLRSQGATAVRTLIVRH